MEYTVLYKVLRFLTDWITLKGFFAFMWALITFCCAMAFVSALRARIAIRKNPPKSMADQRHADGVWLYFMFFAFFMAACPYRYFVGLV